MSSPFYLPSSTVDVMLTRYTYTKPFLPPEAASPIKVSLLGFFIPPAAQDAEHNVRALIADNETGAIEDVPASWISLIPAPPRHNAN